MNNHLSGIRLNNPTPFVRVEIGTRQICEYKEDNSLKNNILTLVYFCKSVVEFFIILFISPFFIGYLIYRIGLKKTIKLFKRIDREVKSKKIK